MWRCRRGIRELDLLLTTFVERHFDDLSEPEKREFEKLLEQADQDILTWVMGRAVPPDAETARLVAKIAG